MTEIPRVLSFGRWWPDDDLEREIVTAAGFQFISGPAGVARPAAELEEAVREHRPSAILSCAAPVTRTVIESCAELRVIAESSVGVDNIDVDAATERAVQVTNVPDYCIPEVSDHAVALVLALTRGIVSADRAVHAGRWDSEVPGLRRLGSLTCGVVGYGRIGQETARKLGAFGCRVLATDPQPITPAEGVQMVDLDTLLTESDVVVLHVPLTPQTRGLIRARQLATMRPGSLLVNAGRGGVVDTAAVTAALAQGQLAGAGLDVLDTEPEVPTDLLAQDGAVVTPHIGYSSDAALLELRQTAVQEIVRVLRGESPRHPCNTPAVEVIA